jgi:chromate reductase, NAD(P)H dehydrogenase (quinone)
MDRPLTFLGIAGSLRRESYNRAALRAAQRLCPQGVTLETFDIASLPLYNQDEERAPPVVLAELKRRIRAADAIVFATPEYNYSMSGVLKNALDCASRPYGDNAWAGKPVAIMSASVGQFGGMRAQYHLRQSLVFLDMYPVNQPEVAIPNAAKAFGPDGDLVDETSRELIRRLLAALADWTRRLQPAGPRHEAAANDETARRRGPPREAANARS